MVSSRQPFNEHSAEHHRATSQKPDNSFIVDLDAEKGQTPRGDRENKHRVVIKFAKKVQLATVRAYVEGEMDFDNGVLEGISNACLPPVTNVMLTIFRLP